MNKRKKGLSYMRTIGSAGGTARAASLTPAERTEAAKKAATAPRKPDTPRCPCGALTLARAITRCHKCEAPKKRAKKS